MDPCIVALGGNGVVHRMMPPIELAERLTLLLALAVFFGSWESGSDRDVRVGAIKT